MSEGCKLTPRIFRAFKRQSHFDTVVFRTAFPLNNLEVSDKPIVTILRISYDLFPFNHKNLFNAPPSYDAGRHQPPIPSKILLHECLVRPPFRLNKLPMELRQRNSPSNILKGPLTLLHPVRLLNTLTLLRRKQTTHIKPSLYLHSPHHSHRYDHLIP